MNIFEQYINAGLSCIPVENKIPKISSWKRYQNEIPAIADAKSWNGDVALICGKISGGLLCIDFDTKNGDKFQGFLMVLNEHYPVLLGKLVYEQTPSGGFHVVFRTDKAVKNLKLANNVDGQATIETRGEGGYFVCSPSKNYKMYFGEFTEIQKITEEETEIILSVSASFNEKFVEDVQVLKDYNRTENNGGLSPFDDYNSRHDIIGLLQSHGWRVVFQRNGKTYFQRPDKEGRGISASWNHIPDRFYVFSTSTTFEHQHIYKASAVYAILEHGGDFNRAAKELSEQGYGDKGSAGRLKAKKPAQAVILNPDSMKTKLLDIYHNGYLRGTTTGWNNLDCFYSVIKGQFTVVTGMPSHGKSEFMDAMAMNLSVKNGWKFAVFAPENYPVEMHYHKLIEKYVKKPLTHGDNKMSITEMNNAIDYVNEHFYFIDATEDEINLECILNQAQALISNKKIDGLIIDPFNEIELDKPKDQSATEYIGKCLRISRKFARRNNIHLWIVAHPIKMRKDQDGKYPVPELYDIEGSAHWRNKADNGICIHRDYEKELTEVHIQKIKYRYCGRQGECYLKYDIQSGGFYETTNNSSNINIPEDPYF